MGTWIRSSFQHRRAESLRHTSLKRTCEKTTIKIAVFIQIHVFAETRSCMRMWMLRSHSASPLTLQRHG